MNRLSLRNNRSKFQISRKLSSVFKGTFWNISQFNKESPQDHNM
jgi:hypothetical protein